jgi:ParB-like nuclease domain
VFYARNLRKNDAAVDRMCSSIREFGFKIPVLARSDGEVVDGHLRLKAARKLGITEVPVVLCDEWTPAQVKAFRLMVNRSVTWADWDEELLGLELQELNEADFDLSLTGFDPKEIDDLLLLPDDDDRANAAPPVPENPGCRVGDLWLCGKHRVLCGDSTSPKDVARLLADRKPSLMVTDPPYGIELDIEWRDRAGLNSCGPAETSYMNRRTEGHTETTISGDTRADWSEAFELLPSLQIAYVWHASVFTREVLNGLLRIGFLYPQQIIWNKGRTVLTRTHYWYQHEPCWYVRKKNAPWFGKAGENSTIWDSPSPKFIMGGADEEKFDHPTQKPVELMRRPILNHTSVGNWCTSLSWVVAPPWRPPNSSSGSAAEWGWIRSTWTWSFSVGSSWPAKRPNSTAMGGRSMRSPRNAGARRHESGAAAGRSRTSNLRSAPGTRTCRGCAWPWPIGRRS